MLGEIIAVFFERGEFLLGLTREHIQISLLAICFATGLGLLLGVFISEYRRLTPFVLGVVNFVYTIPSISLLGLLIPFSGIGNRTSIIALTVYALLPMVRNTCTGIAGIDPEVLEAAKGMGSTRWQILYKIKLPLAFPVILSGFRSMVVMTISLAGIASFIGAGGLGVAIYRGITTNNLAVTLAGSLSVAVLALLADLLIGTMERLLRKRKRTLLLRGVAAAVAFALLLICIVPNGGQKQSIKIATKPMTEQFILGEMLSLLIEEHTDYSVELTKGIGGGTSNIHPALLRGDFDLYPEYTGTSWSFVLKHETLPPQEELFQALKAEYAADYQLAWTGLYGFDNTYSLAVRRELAEQYGLNSFSDLARISSQLVFGAEYDFFEREDGYDALCDDYGFTFQRAMDLDIGLKYTALLREEADVIVVFTTDGQLSSEELVVLEDNRSFFEHYLCGTVVRQDVLDRYSRLEDTLLIMDGLITDADMAEMNYAVESQGRGEREVAQAFLTGKGLLEVVQ